MAEDGHYSVHKLRRGAAHFLAGKLAGALLTMASFALTARLLGLTEYGTYATLLAAVELMMGLCTLGLDWTTGRYLPEFRVKGSAAQLRHFLWQIFALQAGCLLVVALLAAAFSVDLAARLGTPDLRIVVCYAAVLVFEGAARVVRDQFLGLLLAQAAAQLATLSRSLSLLLLLCLVWQVGPAPSGGALVWVAAAELAAAVVSLAVGSAALARLVRRHLPDAAGADCAAWTPPSRRTLLRLARNAYISTLLVLPAGGPVITLVLRALAGHEAAGAFGFARGLVDQVRRFLPIELFLGLIRAGVVARYAASRDFAALNFQMGLMFALSVLAAMPILAVLMGQAGVVANVIGGTAFAQAGPVLATWSASLLLFPHRRTVELVAYTAGRSEACIAGGVVLALSPLLVAAFLHAGSPPELALLGALLADLGFSAVVVWVLHRTGLPYRWSARTLASLALLQLLGTLTLTWLPRLPGQGVVQELLLAVAVAMLLTWGMAALFKPFSSSAREAINRLLPRPWFPF